MIKKVTAIIFIILIVVNRIFKEETWYIQGLITEFAGIVFTLLIVETISNRNREKIEKKEEREQILRNHKLITISIKRYKRIAYEMLTPLGEIKEFKEEIPNEIKILDLVNLWTSSLDIRKSFNKNKSYYYFLEFKNLNEVLKNSILQTNYKFFPKIYDVILSTLEKERYYDVGDSIEFFMNEESLNMKDLLIKYEKNINIRDENTIFTPFEILVESLNHYRNFINEYEEEITKLLEDKD